MKEFIAITDDLLATHPELYFHLVPYHVDRPCRRLEQKQFDVTPADIQVSDYSQPENKQ